jgi:hypothetical protein
MSSSHGVLAGRVAQSLAPAMIQAAEIERMGLEERLQTMELLWASLARTPEAVPSPAWHGEVLAGRLAKIERGDGQFLTLTQLKERLQKPAP